MMSFEWWMSVIGFALAIAGAGTFIMSFSKNKLGQSTIDLMAQNKKAQDDAIKRLQDDSKSKDKQISNLAGQVQVLKDVPLAQIAKSLEVVSQTHSDMQKFLSDHETGVHEIAAAVADSAAEKVIEFIKNPA